MKFVFVAILGALALAGCQEKLTLEQAQAECAKKGGFLVVISTQKITAAGPGEEVESPGNCVSSSKFDVAASPPAPAH
ncbi:MAG TPA: hypothetical protein VFI23_14305 [Rhizomicrobium sp.]|nr:hypothetical protein [Rhizomicrobium sp.]